MADWRSHKCERVVRSSLAGETQADVETLDMLELTRVFYSVPGPWKSLGDAEPTIENQHKSRVITAKSWYDA